MQIIVSKLTEICAKEICEWRYEKPHDIYNMPNWSVVKEHNWGIANEAKRNNEFYAVFENNKLIGFFRLLKSTTIVTLGLGLHPHYCGKGFGYKLVELALAESKTRYEGIPVRLEVRCFNQRAIKCYERMGFMEINRYAKNTPTGIDDLIVMEHHAEEATHY